MSSIDFHVFFVPLGDSDLTGSSKQSFSESQVVGDNVGPKENKWEKWFKVGTLELFISKFFFGIYIRKYKPILGFYNCFAHIIIFYLRNYQLNCPVLLCQIGSAQFYRQAQFYLSGIPEYKETTMDVNIFIHKWTLYKQKTGKY